MFVVLRNLGLIFLYVLIFLKVGVFNCILFLILYVGFRYSLTLSTNFSRSQFSRLKFETQFSRSSDVNLGGNPFLRNLGGIFPKCLRSKKNNSVRALRFRANAERYAEVNTYTDSEMYFRPQPRMPAHISTGMPTKAAHCASAKTGIGLREATGVPHGYPPFHTHDCLTHNLFARVFFFLQLIPARF